MERVLGLGGQFFVLVLDRDGDGTTARPGTNTRHGFQRMPEKGNIRAPKDWFATVCTMESFFFFFFQKTAFDSSVLPRCSVE